MSSFALLQVLSHLFLPIYPIPLSQRKEKELKKDTRPVKLQQNYLFLCCPRTTLAVF